MSPTLQTQSCHDTNFAATDGIVMIAAAVTGANKFTIMTF